MNLKKKMLKEINFISNNNTRKKYGRRSLSFTDFFIGEFNSKMDADWQFIL